MPHLETAWLRKSTLSSLRGPFPGRSQQRGGGHASLTRRLPSTPPSLESSRGLRTERSKKNLTSEADMEHRPGREVGRLKEVATGARTRPANGRFPSVPWSPGRSLWRVLPRPVARGKRAGSVSGEETRVLRATGFGERFS